MIRIGMCDDDINNINPVKKLIESQIIENNFDAEISIVTTEQNEIYDKIFSKQIDVLFLDMDFKNSNTDGIEFAKQLRKINKEFYLIFLTAHQRYMPISFLAKVFDYIVKPTNKDVISDLIYRLKSEFKYNKNIFLKVNRWISVRTDDILYIEKMNNKAKIVTLECTNDSLKTLDNLLDELPNNFRKCHRSFILNENKVIKVDKKQGYAYFTNKIKCPINSKFDI